MGITSDCKLKKLPFVISLCFIFSVLTLISCNNTKKEQPVAEDKEPQDAFHADNDIAMTVRSLVDAIKVGEAIDSTEYDFTGVLTDGLGAPLYTNQMGLPGEWMVDVIDKYDVSIKNIDIGDLLPGDLESYLLSCLQLGPEQKVCLTTEDDMENCDIEVSIYDFQGGYIRFENRTVTASSGIEGYLFTIILSSNLPKGVETQIAV